MIRWSAAMSAAIACLASAGAYAQDADKGFLRMDGKWRSTIVRAEPEALLDDPRHAAPFHIEGRRADDRDVIFFTAYQIIDGRKAGGHVVHAYDEASDTTFGVVSTQEGVLRVITEHGEDEDVARFYDASGALVVTEHMTWPSDDVLESASVYDRNGETTRVWFVTERVKEGALQ